MRTLQLNKMEVLCVPDEENNASYMATYDTTGWIQLGRMGSNDSILIDKSEWTLFLAFLNELEANMRENTVGAYSPERVVE